MVFRSNARRTGGWTGLLFVAICLGGCGGGSGKGALVRVGEVEITDIDLREYRAGLPQRLRPAETGEAGIRDLLQSLVDRQLLVQEARSRGYEQDSSLVSRLHRLYVERLAGTLIKEDLANSVQITEEEIQKAYKEDHWDQQHRPAHILSATEAQAQEVLKALRQGRDFAQLARERSLRDGERGGDLGQYFGPEDVASEIGEVVLGLPAGELAGPIHTRDGYEVIKILDVQQVPLEAVRSKINTALYRQKFVQERQRYLEKLEAENGVVYHQEGIAALIAAGRSGGELSPAQQALPLLTYGDRVLTAEDGKRVLIGPKRPPNWVADSLNVVQALRVRLLADSLLVMEARKRGLDRKPEFLAYEKERRERLLIDLLRQQEVLDKLQASDEEIRQYYEAGKQQYKIPARAEVTEILAATEAQARQLLAQVRAGADMAALARQHSLRPGARTSGGRLRFYEGQTAQWGGLYEPLLKAGVGTLIGPVKVERWWGLYRVDSRAPEQMRSLEEVKDRVRLQVKKVKESGAFAAYMEELRAKYKDRVQWFDKRIAALAASGDAADKGGDQPGKADSPGS